MRYVLADVDERVMGPQRKTVAAAWSIYEDLLSLPAVVFAPEPEGTEERLAEHCRKGGDSSRIWTDAYLAAFARAGGLGLVTFDRGYRSFEKLDLILLA